MNEAKAAMLKAQELMAKYEIEQDRIDPERKKERPVVCFASPMFRDDWCVDVGSLIANNFRCRAIISQRRENDVLRQAGYVDGKAFQNAGDKERLAYES